MIDLPSYEESIRARAEAAGHDVIKENGGLTVLADDGTEAWHKLGGHAEDRHNRRHAAGGKFLEPGRWIKDNDGVEAWAAEGDYSGLGERLP